MLKDYVSAKVGGIALVSCLLLSACASTPEECDPSQDQGFFGKMGCVVTGSYEARVKAKQQRVADLRAEVETLNQMTRDIQAQNRALMGDYLARLQVLDKTKLDLMELESQLAKKKALSVDLQEQIDGLKGKVAQMSTKSAASKSIAKKEKEIEELNAQIEALSQSMTM